MHHSQYASSRDDVMDDGFLKGVLHLHFQVQVDQNERPKTEDGMECSACEERHIIHA